VKLHVQLNHAGYLPSYMVITDGKSSDIAVARHMKWAKGTIVVFDRGYVDYQWWQSIDEDGAFFVTRHKKDIPLEVVEERTAPQNSNVLKDQVVRLRSDKLAGGELELRLVTIWNEEKQEEMAFLTNHLKLGATTIAGIYKDRWQIELFFKSLKQLLRVKTFVGTSANALKTQVWTALIAALLFKFVQLRSKRKWSLSNLVALIRQQLFVYRDLFQLLDNDLQPPVELAAAPDDQLVINFVR
jgi:IS4 transposase